MPHLRNRHGLALLEKKLKFSPVVAIQGARQTGKSVLAREILPKTLKKSRYVSLDQPSQRMFASENPETFLAQHEEAQPLIIDEAQKVPDIFDAIKFRVDTKRRPGSYLLLGSTEFSKLSKIRESLTGRLSRIALYPMNMAETLKLPPNSSHSDSLVKETCRITRSQLMKYLVTGGMPALFSIHDERERNLAMQDWLDLTAKRDALGFPDLKIEGELVYQILEQIVQLEEPTAGHIAKALRRDPRKINTHLKVLQTLFVIHPISPHASGSGKCSYFILDVGLATRLGASFERQLQTFLLNEYLSQYSYRGLTSQMNYYRGPKGGIIHFVIKTPENLTAIKILSQEKIDRRELEILKAFRKKLSPQTVNLIALGGGRFSNKKDRIEIYPWESVV